MKPIVWSYGGGVQSVAILALICSGKLQPPERVIMADTGRERSSTWDYTTRYAIPYMKAHGMTLEVVGHEYATLDLYSADGATLIPTYTATGKSPTYCSNQWKQRPVRRYLREQGYGPKKPVIQWLGISLDEIERMRISDLQWIKYDYPLALQFKLRRHECVLEIERAGLPIPPKSSCWMCPHMNNSEWSDIAQNWPDDLRKAAELEREISAKDIERGYTGLYLHKSRLPIDQVDFTAKAEAQEMLCSDSCWT